MFLFYFCNKLKMHTKFGAEKACTQIPHHRSETILMNLYGEDIHLAVILRFL